ncbi:uncharacterized protein LOC111639268 [Centruroides sculpturatus]|uniref:uncharacterized protein LOC111639268 n=1 Tax=Centruroides sculpturatus TaxID=218467 RepID=UPI000C6D9FA1|nr:uncharacterized protein LOC111639268 [Centruroides sculpturatus]XP_023240869.1 uncharacterized protein LOC111639268 [Centruroides sculpturatus]XP_023240870.1 uncharacterized protein LOC111639268 [Centruroides sculpturatus]XP_023240871.1 uncharacterized protein LOC111639268 [Centruroides sculpturatus]
MEGDPEEYEKYYPNFYVELIAKTLECHLPLMQWSNEDILLDIGCGSGKVTKQILLPKCPKIKKIVATDAVAKAIDFAKIKYPHDKIEYKNQNIMERIDVQDEKKYDKIFSSYAFHYFKDYDKLFSNISSLLKPGGYFTFLTIAKGPQISTRKVLAEASHLRPYLKSEEILESIPPTHDWEDVEYELTKLISKYDLNAIKCVYEEFDVPFPSRDHFMKFMEIVIPEQFFKEIPPETKKELWNQMETLFFKNGVREEGDKIIFPNGILSVFGQKRN